MKTGTGNSEARTGKRPQTATTGQLTDDLQELQRDLGVDSAELSSAIRSAAADPLMNCPSADQLAEFVGDEDLEHHHADGSQLTASTREDIADHLAHCEQCRTATLVLANALEGLKPKASEAEGLVPPEHQRTGGSWGARQWLSAAAVVVALGAGGWWASTRSTAQRSTQRDASVVSVVPTENAVLQRLPQQFVWPVQIGATSYRVVLFSESGQRLWRSQATTEPRLDPRDLGELENGHYAWEIHVEGRVKSSVLGPFWFELGE